MLCRLILGVLQMNGAAVGILSYLLTGTSKLTVAVASGTLLFTLLSLALFGGRRT